MIITGEAKEEFDALNKVVGEEIAKEITSSDHHFAQFNKAENRNIKGKSGIWNTYP